MLSAAVCAKNMKKFGLNNLKKMIFKNMKVPTSLTLDKDYRAWYGSGIQNAQEDFKCHAM